VTGRTRWSVKSYERQERKHVNFGADWIQERSAVTHTELPEGFGPQALLHAESKCGRRKDDGLTLACRPILGGDEVEVERSVDDIGRLKEPAERGEQDLGVSLRRKGKRGRQLDAQRTRPRRGEPSGIGKQRVAPLGALC
jgi:hypothetical protein